MYTYSQRDPKWATEKIKGSELTIGRFGCLITTIATLSLRYGESLTPSQVNSHCAFTPGGLLIWASCRFDNFVFVRRQYGRLDGEILAAQDSPDGAVVLQVANYSHWVLAIGYDTLTRLLLIADPWLGDETTMARYKDSITGAAYFKQK